MRLIACLLALLLLSLAACEGAAHTSPPDGTAGPARTTSPAATSPGGPTASVPAGLVEAVVTGVVDGDTIHVEIDGVDYALRYIGIDTPETHAPGQPIECFGPEASAFNEQLVLGKTVALEKDVSETDRFGRLLRYVYLGAEMVNAILVREGYAEAIEYPPDVKYQDTLEEAERAARASGRGEWAVCTPTPTPTFVQLPAGTCEYSGTSEPVIKGNINSKGERIYHVPGQQDYDKTQINEAKGERWFCTEAEAVAAGWRKAKA